MLQPTDTSTQSNMLESKYWTIVAELPSPRTIQETGGNFFNDMDWDYSILERHYFDRLNGSWLKASGFENGKLRRGSLKELSQGQLYYFN
jgi:hypothetical protein